MTDSQTPAKTETDLPPIAERVAKGVAWLDANRPGWVDKVEIQTLEMTSPCRCILGQVFADDENVDSEPYGMTGFDVGVAMAVLSEEDESVYNWAEAYGFDLPLWEDTFDEGDETPWDNLAEAWADVIDTRRAAR